MRGRILMLAATIMVAGCGELPRPFQHDGPDSPLVAPRAMRAIAVAELPELPGLAKALVAALDQEDIAAVVGPGGDSFLRLDGKIEAGRLHWFIVSQRGEPMGDFTQPIEGKLSDPSVTLRVAARTAQSVGKLLREDDFGASDLAARPRIALDKVLVTGGLDGELLRRSLITALERQGIAVVTDQPQMRVNGMVRITQGLAGHDLVEITWVVVDDKGVEIGKVNQGSPVMRDEMLKNAIQMTHQIAEGGAEGIKQVVRSKI